jgi:hypothetical protein
MNFETSYSQNLWYSMCINRDNHLHIPIKIQKLPRMQWVTFFVHVEYEEESLLDEITYMYILPGR